MIAALLLLQVAAGIPGFAGIEPSGEERLAQPHVADALRAVDAAERKRSLNSALAFLPAPTRFRGAFQCMRGSMLLSAAPQADKAEGLAAIEECYKLLPELPLAQRIRADMAFGERDVRLGARLLARAVSANPRLARNLPDDQLDTVFRQLGYAGAFVGRRALVTAMAKTDVAGRDPARFSGWVRESVMERVEHGDLAGAGALLRYVIDPADGVAMLIDRRFEPVWPRIDEWAGGNLEAQRSALLAATRAAYDADPTLGQARETARVLAANGLAEDGLALLERAITAFGPARNDYGYARAVVRLSKLRAQTGERDGARVLQPMQAALAGGGLGPYLINVVPNLALAQVALGQPAAALATLDHYPTTPDSVEMRAAYGYFVAIRGCALMRLERRKEAEAAFAEVAVRYRANDGAVDLATRCGGSDDKVLAAWLHAVEDPERRGGALLAMTLARAGVSDDPLSPTERRLRAIATRAEVDAGMNRYGRTLPAGYQAVLKRIGH